MRIAIITVTYNSAAALPAFLSALSIASDEADVTDVIAVDNASTDHSVELLQRSPVPITVIANGSNRGYAAGINVGLSRVSKVDAFLILNPDVRLRPGSVRALTTALSADPARGIVVPRAFRDDDEPRFSLRRDPSVLRAWAELLLTAERSARIGRLGERIGDPTAYEHAHAVDWASGSAMLLGAHCVAATGRWDETFFLYSEETDYCMRARARGFEVHFTPAAQITHLGGESRTSPQLHALLFRNRLRLFRKHHGSAATVAFATPLMLKQLLKAFIGSEHARLAIADLLHSRRRRASPVLDYLQGGDTSLSSFRDK